PCLLRVAPSLTADPPATAAYPLSLHDALPIFEERGRPDDEAEEIAARTVNKERARSGEARQRSRSSVKDISSGRRGGLRSHKGPDRKSTRLNSSHVEISYAVFCLKKKNNNIRD